MKLQRTHLLFSTLFLLGIGSFMGYAVLSRYITVKYADFEEYEPVNDQTIDETIEAQIQESQPYFFGRQILLTLGIMSLAGIVILSMSKVEYRAYLTNRVLHLHTAPHRLTMEEVLENENRTKIIDLIIDQPGIHNNELVRQTGLSPGNLAWHLKILELYKIIKSEILGKFVVYFPYYDENPISRIDLKLQKSTTTMEILDLIRDNSGITQIELARQIGKNHKTVKYHLDKLQEAGLVVFEKQGRKKQFFLI